MTTSLIPSNELSDFMQLPEDERPQVEAWLYAVTAVRKPVQKSLADLARTMGVSKQTARRKYDAWRKGRPEFGVPPRHWRSLVNLTKTGCGAATTKLKPETITHFKSLCEANGRKCAPAYRQFVRDFRASHVPGLQGGPGASLPAGCSYENLMRYAPSEFELTAARIGRGAAADFRPKLFTSRVGMSVGQRYIFDDLWHDFKVTMIGQARAMRLLQLHAHDLYSACQFARGLKPRMETPEGTSVGLKEHEMLFLVAHVLAEFGFHPDGCVLMVEHGTAAIREELERVLFDITGGKVTVDRSGIQGASSFAGQYDGRSKGNFRFKASLESLGNLIHNETANMLAFPGQTGSNARLNAPEELHGRERHAESLLKAILALSPEHQSKLRLPFLEFNQARWLVEEVMRLINNRTDHDLQGWLEAGLTIMDMDIPGIGLMDAQKYLGLSLQQQEAIDAVAKPMPRKMSPREVFDAGRHFLIRLRPEAVARLLHGVTGREAKVGEDHLITFEDQLISPEPLRYLAHTLEVGDKFTVVVNPMGPDTAHLFDARGRWMGQVSAWQAVTATDIEGLHRQMGQAAKIEKQLLAPIAQRGAAITRQRIEDSKHNAEILKGSQPVTVSPRPATTDLDCTEEILERSSDEEVQPIFD